MFTIAQIEQNLRITRANFDSFKGTTIGSFRILPSLAKNFKITSTPTDADLDNIFDRVAHNAVNRIVDRYPILLDIDLLQMATNYPYDYAFIQEAVYYEIQHMIRNGYYEHTRTSSISNGSLTINIDKDQLLNTWSALGYDTIRAMNNSRIDQYSIVEGEIRVANFLKEATQIVQEVEIPKAIVLGTTKIDLPDNLIPLDLKETDVIEISWDTNEWHIFRAQRINTVSNAIRFTYFLNHDLYKFETNGINSIDHTTYDDRQQVPITVFKIRKWA